MRPALAIDNFRDGATLNIQRSAYGRVCFSSRRQRANHADCGVGECRSMMSLAFLAPVASHVLHIGGGRIPPKIAELIVAGITIVVTGVIALWSRSSEGFKDQMSHIAAFTANYDHWAHVMRALRFIAPWLQLSPIITKSPFVINATPDRSVGADTISNWLSNVAVSNHLRSISQGPLEGVNQ